ncbi:phage tail protein [Latilactobacillus sakei]|uniref:phage tail protein n=1 Tax=Latilactobacillus sakei TaxID=1599 RepID=UPI0038840822
MYTITEYDSPTDSIGKVIFNVATNKLVSAGKLTLKESDIDDFELSVNQNNPLFGRVKPLQTHIVLKQDNTILFKGRALKPKHEMTSSGQFVQSFSFESILAYLLDSTQRFREVHNTSPADFFRLLITAHNSQVPAYKQFKVGNVDVTNSTDNVYRFIDYANTYNTIKDKLISRLGGFLRVRIESDGNYIDYLKDPGKEHSTDNPIKVGRNLKSASVEIDPTNVITRFIPLGATIESNNPNGETNVANPRITIASVNGGRDYIDIPELQAVFGIINGTNVWDDVHTPETLKPKAEQWVRDQTAAEEHWTISAVEIGLDRFKTFNVSDSYQFINPAVAEPQLLRITQKVIDVLSPHSSSLTIGDKKKTLTQYQSDALNAAKQVDVLKSRVAAQTAKIVTISNEMKTTNEALTTAQKELTLLKTEYDKLIENIGDANFKAIMAKLTELENQTTTIINNLGEIGQNVLDLEEFKTNQEATNANQLMTNEQQKTKNKDFEKRILALENGGNK